MSHGNAAFAAGNPTESLIRDAFLVSASKRITINPAFLDDEKLPEGERVAVLKEVFHRNIRLKQLERLARCLSLVLGGVLPPNVLVYGPSGIGKSVSCLHFLSALHALCLHEGISFHYFYVDLTTPHTCFGALNELAIALDGRVRRYRKGIALAHMEETVIRALAPLDVFGEDASEEGAGALVLCVVDEPAGVGKDPRPADHVYP